MSLHYNYVMRAELFLPHSNNIHFSLISVEFIHIIQINQKFKMFFLSYHQQVTVNVHKDHS